MCLKTLDVALLCGGKGSRFAKVIPGIPKVLAPIGGQPWLHRLLRGQVGEANRIVLCTGYLGDVVEDFIDAIGWDNHANIRISREREPLGTLGALKLARPLLTSEPVVVMNGDTMVFSRMPEFLKRYRSQHCRAAVMQINGQSAGIYALSQMAMESVWRSRRSSLEEWAMDCADLIEMEGMIIDFGTPQGYELAQKVIQE